MYSDRECRLKHESDCLNTHMRRVCRAVAIEVASAVGRRRPMAGRRECLCCRVRAACKVASGRERSAKGQEQRERLKESRVINGRSLFDYTAVLLIFLLPSI